jgi:hypothetical protein
MRSANEQLAGRLEKELLKRNYHLDYENLAYACCKTSSEET